MKLSVVIPVLNERELLPQALAALARIEPAPEVVVVDGGSTDGTRPWLEAQPGIRVFDTLRGRGRQLDAGARAATGDVLLFLHADSVLPAAATRKIEQALRSPGAVAGCFRVCFDQSGPWSLRVVAAGINLRTRLTRSGTGDQAIFMRRAVYQEAGGFPEWPLFEDVELVSRIKRWGRFCVLDDAVTISPRRFLRFGVWSTTLRMYGLRLAFYAGVSPFTLARWFEDVRPHLLSSREAANPDTPASDLRAAERARRS
ncbi:MAG: TIGR04283 family arsenosugar biosynthesis glycosyltransferase [Acidobacteria bacterium]|nr:TIGR04283 family arsenosugar biosynthesis glycosyltransferase [Acidobacteriota bacterium]